MLAHGRLTGSDFGAPVAPGASERPLPKRARRDASQHAPKRSNQASARAEFVEAFGRVPRSLHGRLERAVVELRDEFEDLTQEQGLAALLHEPAVPAYSGVLPSWRTAYGDIAEGSGANSLEFEQPSGPGRA